jgi:hypothetical protein
MDGLFSIDAPEAPSDLGVFFARDDIPWFVDLKSSNFFAVQPSGEPEADQSLGEFVANEALAYARRHRNGAVIAFALSSIAERPVGQLEAGFIIRIAAAAMVAAQN